MESCIGERNQDFIVTSENLKIIRLVSLVSWIGVLVSGGELWDRGVKWSRELFAL